MFDTSAITDGSWDNNEKAADIARRMKKADLKTLIISLDPFHEKNSPKLYVQYIENLIKAAKAANIENISLNQKFAEHFYSKNKNNQKMKKLLKEFCNIKEVRIINRTNEDKSEHILYTGRVSKKSFSKYNGKLVKPSAFCPLKKKFMDFLIPKRHIILIFATIVLKSENIYNLITPKF